MKQIISSINAKGMNEVKTELWNEHSIRFVQVEDEWWAVGKDVATALGYAKPENAIITHVSNEDKTSSLIQGSGSNYKSKTIIINEFGTYDLVFSSKLPQAKEFKRWVFNVIKQLRDSAGIEGFQIFRTLDKEHQKQMMSNLSKSLKKPVRKDFIKANTIANKAVSTANGYPKMIKKAEMSPTMLAQREAILKDAVELMGMKDKYGLDLSVSKTIYKKVSVNE